MSDFSHLSMEELQDELATLAAHIYAGTCRFLELLGEIDRRGTWADSGCGSCAEWLAWRCALMPRAAREHVRVARRLPELPLIHAAFARGEISYAKVRALTRVAEPDSEEELLALGRVLTAAQLERAVRAFRRVSAADAARQHEEERVGYWWDDDGALVIRGRLAPEDGALFLRALDAMRESLWERGEEERGSAEPAAAADERRGAGCDGRRGADRRDEVRRRAPSGRRARRRPCALGRLRGLVRARRGRCGCARDRQTPRV